MIYSSSSEFRNRAWQAMESKWLQAALVMLVYVLIAMGASSCTWGALTILLLPMEYAFTVAFLRMVRGEKEMEVVDLFTVYKEQFERTFLVMLLMDIFIFLWTLLLIVPGIIKAYSYSMAPYILHDNPEMTASQAIDESMRLMEGNKMNLFMLDLSFIGWWLLVLLTGGLLAFVVAPYHLTARAEFYRELIDPTNV